MVFVVVFFVMGVSFMVWLSSGWFFFFFFVIFLVVVVLFCDCLCWVSLSCGFLVEFWLRYPITSSLPIPLPILHSKKAPHPKKDGFDARFQEYFFDQKPLFYSFHQLGPLGWVGLVVVMSVCLCVCVSVCLMSPPMRFFPRPLIVPQVIWSDPGLSLALRSHDQMPAWYWSTSPPPHSEGAGYHNFLHFLSIKEQWIFA